MCVVYRNYTDGRAGRVDESVVTGSSSAAEARTAGHRRRISAVLHVLGRRTRQVYQQLLPVASFGVAVDKTSVPCSSRRGESGRRRGHLDGVPGCGVWIRPPSSTVHPWRHHLVPSATVDRRRTAGSTQAGDEGGNGGRRLVYRTVVSEFVFLFSSSRMSGDQWWANPNHDLI